MFGSFLRNALPRLMGIGQKITSGLNSVGSKILHTLQGFRSAGDGLARGLIGKEKVIEDIGEGFVNLPFWFKSTAGRHTIPEATMGKAGEFLGHFT